MNGRTRIVFVPIKNGDVIEEVTSADGELHFVGFKPGPAGKASGWLVYRVHEGTVTRRDWRGQPSIHKIPSRVGVHKRRAIA